MTRPVETLTNFGDLAVLLPVAAVVTIWLFAIRERNIAIWWLVAMVFCLASTAILKIYFFICPPLSDLHSPGHTSLSVLVYGALTLTSAAALCGWRRYVMIAIGTAFIAGISASRVLVQAHSIPEVVSGLILGGVALALFAKRYSMQHSAEPWLRPMVAACLVLMLLLNGQKLRFEAVLEEVGLYLHPNLACVYLKANDRIHISTTELLRRCQASAAIV